MPFGQSMIAAFIAAEIAGYIAEERNAKPQEVRRIKCVVSVGVGAIAAVVTVDPVGAIGSMALGAAYLGGYNPLPLIVPAFNSIGNSRPSSNLRTNT